MPYYHTIKVHYPFCISIVFNLALSIGIVLDFLALNIGGVLILLTFYIIKSLHLYIYRQEEYLKMGVSHEFIFPELLSHI